MLLSTGSYVPKGTNFLVIYIYIINKLYLQQIQMTSVGELRYSSPSAYGT